MDLHRALAEISAIRGQLARGAQFRGYGPPTLALTGILALLVATLQSHWLGAAARNVASYLQLWVAIAVLSLLIIGAETIARSRRIHSGMAREMINRAIEQFLPALVAGVLLTVVLLRFAPSNAWMLPGLWQILFSVGVFSSYQFSKTQERNRPQTQCRITATGRKRFLEYLSVLEQAISDAAQVAKSDVTAKGVRVATHA